MSFWKPNRPHRLSRGFKIFLGIAYPAVFLIAWVVHHFVRLHVIKTAGTDAWMNTDAEVAKGLGIVAAIYFGLPVCLLTFAGLLKLLLIAMKRYEARSGH